MPTISASLLLVLLRRGGGGAGRGSSLFLTSNCCSSSTRIAASFSQHGARGVATATEQGGGGEGEQGSDDSHSRRRRRRNSSSFSSSSSSTSSSSFSTSSSSSSPEPPPPPYPSFVPLSPFQRAALAVAASVGAALDPTRADLVAAAGEATGTSAFASAARRMARSPTGRRLLLERPRVTDETLARARRCGPGTFGEAYAKFMDDRGFSPSERPPVRFIEEMGEEEEVEVEVEEEVLVDGESNATSPSSPSSSSSSSSPPSPPPRLFLLPRDAAAYAATRSRECHDFWHVLFGCRTTVLGELALKGVEFAQLGLPSAAAAVAGAAWRLRAEDRGRLATRLVPWAARAGSRAADLLCLYYEEHFAEDLEELRGKWRIEPAPSKNDEAAARWRRPGVGGWGDL